MSSPDLSLNGFKHQENITVPPVSAKHWQTQLTQLSQQQTVPEADGEKRKDNCEEEMTTDMVFMTETSDRQIKTIFVILLFSCFCHLFFFLIKFSLFFELKHRSMIMFHHDLSH